MLKLDADPLELAIYPKMSRNPKPLPFLTIPTYTQKLLYAVNGSIHRVLSYDPAKLELVTHYWQVTMTSALLLLELALCRPINDGTRVPPDGLCQYRQTHEYRGPGCLCPLLEPLRKEPAYKEAAIYLTTDGPYKGEYVAECTEHRCGYLGWSSLHQFLDEEN